MSDYYPPVFKDISFHCPRCGVFASQDWGNLNYSNGMAYIETGAYYSKCAHCNKHSIWVNKKLMYPENSTAPMPHTDMPEECRKLYLEARSVNTKSPRSAAALLRLALQLLMIDLGEKGKRINDDIKSLVSTGKLSTEVQMALDYCRVIGNNAVHPGEIDLNDDSEITNKMFEMVNFIVEDRISRPKTISKLFETLPQGAKDAITKRDS